MKSIRQNSLSLGYIIDFIVFDRFEEVFDFSTDWIFQKNEICIQNSKPAVDRQPGFRRGDS